MSRIAPVSVVVPVRNGAEFIGAAIESILGQTFQPAEIVVVDDGSTDDTPAVARSFDKVTCLRQEPSGASAARNLGAARSSQPFLCFLDADDLWIPTKTGIQMSMFEREHQLAIVSGQSQNFSENAGARTLKGGPILGNVPGVMMIRREAFNKVGPFALHLAHGENLEWWSRAIDARLTYASVNEVLLLRRIHARNSSRNDENATRQYLPALREITRRRRQL